MTREEVIRLAKEAGCIQGELAIANVPQLERFAQLVAAAEREAILELRNHEDVMAPVGQSAWGEAYQDGFRIERLIIGNWIDEGEKIFADHRFGVLFRLGCWWADRPWRKK